MVLVSKDINLRLKARALNLTAEDYETVKIKDLDHLWKGKSEIEVSGPRHHRPSLPRRVAAGGKTCWPERPLPNQYFILRSSRSNSGLAYFNPRSERIERVSKPLAYGISPRNAEQTFALHAVLNPDVPLVTLSGAAGTGKTLLALAGALEQRRLFSPDLSARPIVPLSNRDLGFLPGDIHLKIDPNMQPLCRTTYRSIKNQYDKEKEREYRKVEELVETEKLPHRAARRYIPRPQLLERHLHRRRGGART